LGEVMDWFEVSRSRRCLENRVNLLSKIDAREGLGVGKVGRVG